MLYDAVNEGGDVWINENRFRIVRYCQRGPHRLYCCLRWWFGLESQGYFSLIRFEKQQCPYTGMLTLDVVTYWFEVLISDLLLMFG
ncbi:hypothetical protein Vadar_026275 [Vaccinium darrowii]|uniref:Uncharacterized protein n=1 Tax=Vaccinium darrowii TaxID=229202 RepID=A0ACB7ZMN4_9ERIC|nr:hypothetical protein Vadar_026275 [Vaccinium darrowii]